MNKNRKIKILGVLLLAVMGFALACITIANEQARKEQLTYDQVVDWIREGKVVKVGATNGQDQVNIILTDGTERTSIIPSVEELSTIILQENEKGAKIELEIGTRKIESTSLISLAFSCAMLFILLRMISGTENNSVRTAKSQVKFEDVAGINEEKEQLIEIANFLRNPQKYLEMGAKIPKGVLLHGDPGTGKTLLAKAIAGEAEVPFFQISASSLEEKFVGVGASRVRKLFKEAKKSAPCIIFIDEIDAVAQSRYNSKTNAEQTLDQLLSEMDGFDSNDKVIVIAATNHKEVLDPAIVRPGRFDRHIFIPKPDVLGREEILEIHAKNKKMDPKVSLREIARKTIGFSGADLANVLNEAAILAVSQGEECISIADVDEAIARVMVGLEKKRAVISDEDKKCTAIHESGHAIVSAILRPNVKNFGISIVQRGSAGGYNYFDESDTKYVRKTEIQNQIAVLYGGIVAEEILLGDVSTGATGDLKKASKLAYLMVTEFAMGNQLMVKISGEDGYNEQLEGQRIAAAEEICRKAHDEATIVVRKEKDKIQELAELLCEKEYLSQEEVSKFLQKV